MDSHSSLSPLPFVHRFSTVGYIGDLTSSDLRSALINLYKKATLVRLRDAYYRLVVSELKDLLQVEDLDVHLTLDVDFKSTGSPDTYYSPPENFLDESIKIIYPIYASCPYLFDTSTQPATSSALRSSRISITPSDSDFGSSRISGTPSDSDSESSPSSDDCTPQSLRRVDKKLSGLSERTRSRLLSRNRSKFSSGLLTNSDNFVKSFNNGVHVSRPKGYVAESETDRLLRLGVSIARRFNETDSNYFDRTSPRYYRNKDYLDFYRHFNITTSEKGREYVPIPPERRIVANKFPPPRGWRICSDIFEDDPEPYYYLPSIAEIDRQINHV